MTLAKFNPSPPYLRRGPIKFRPGTPNDKGKKIATAAKPLAKFDSLCQDSEVIPSDIAGMFSPKKATPEVSPLEIQEEMVPAVFPVRKGQGGRIAVMIRGSRDSHEGKMLSPRADQAASSSPCRSYR
jgi:hypothetical protein